MPCEQLVCPTALAACTRVDSCFAPWFVPSVGVSIRLAYLELHFCHNLDQLGTGVYLCECYLLIFMSFQEGKSYELIKKTNYFSHEDVQIK